MEEEIRNRKERTMKLVITANGLQKEELRPVVDLARSCFDEVVMNPWGRRGTQDEIRQIWDGADAIIQTGPEHQTFWYEIVVK